MLVSVVCHGKNKQTVVTKYGQFIITLFNKTSSCQTIIGCDKLTV